MLTIVRIGEKGERARERRRGGGEYFCEAVMVRAIAGVMWVGIMGACIVIDRQGVFGQWVHNVSLLYTFYPHGNWSTMVSYTIHHRLASQ